MPLKQLSVLVLLGTSLATGGPCWAGWFGTLVARYSGALVRDGRSLALHAAITEFENSTLGLAWGHTPKLPPPERLVCGFGSPPQLSTVVHGQRWVGSFFEDGGGRTAVRLQHASDRITLHGLADAAPEGPSVVIGNRRYIGRFRERSQEYLGIPYAQPPVGGLRWFPPQPIAPAERPVTVDAHSKFGPMCHQDWQLAPNTDNGMPVGLNPDGSAQRFDESCLVLNLYAPRTASPGSQLPVLVFGHGGGDGDGSSSMGRPLLFNGSNALQSAAHISVTINYRLANLGYLAHPAFGTEANGSQGNFGLLDHLAALRWVRANVRLFGGDPDRVLFWGQSSGANHALWIPVMKPFNGLVKAVAVDSACAQPFLNPDCAVLPSKQAAETLAIQLATKLNCTGGNDDAIRTCLRRVPASKLLGGGSARPYYGSLLLPKLPFESYAHGEFDRTVKLLIGHNSGESVEMQDSCMNNPTLSLDQTVPALERAFSHNNLQPPPFVAAEAPAVYLAPRQDGQPACSAAGNTTSSQPRCCRVYEDFWQDLNMLCSEDVLADAIRSGSARAEVRPPTVYAWRFDAVQACPPASWRGKLSGSCFHTMELSWLFGTVSGFWPWIRPPDGAAAWSCTWNSTSGGERAFSDAAIRLLVTQAAAGNGTVPAEIGWPVHDSQSGARLNLKFGNLSVLRGFRREQCSWWKSVYARMRKPNSKSLSIGLNSM